MARRHDSLIPLTHDHHHALAAARNLRAAASGSDLDRAATAFLALFARETMAHMRYEEEQLFPLLDPDDRTQREYLLRALGEHAGLHRLAAALRHAPTPEVANTAGSLLQEHVRFEERALFPLLEEIAADRLEHLPRPHHGAGLVLGERAVGLRSGRGTGPVWTVATAQLDVNLIDRPPGDSVAPHINEERDVVMIGISGEATVAIDGVEEQLDEGVLLLVPKGSERSLTAGPRGVRYLTIHGAAPGVRIGPPPRR